MLATDSIGLSTLIVLMEQHPFGSVVLLGCLYCVSLIVRGKGKD